MLSQDFGKKMAIVVRDDLPPWQAMNTAAHCAAYLGNKMQDPFDTGDRFVTKDGVRHPQNTQYAIVIVSAKAAELPGLMQEVRVSGLLHLGFIREMIETTSDEEIVQMLKNKRDEEVEYLGIGVFGPKEAVGALTKKFKLWK